MGARPCSREACIARKGQIIVVRSVRRLPVDERRIKDCIAGADRIIWNRYEEDDGA